MFIFELLNELNGQTLNYKELAAIGKVSYGLDKSSVDEIRKRISIFKSAKLIRNVSLDKFSITKRGQLLLEKVSLQERRLSESSTKDVTIPQKPISNMLQFLSSPLIGCVEKTKDGYYATGSLSDAARKFTFYSKCCMEAEDI